MYLHCSFFVQGKQLALGDKMDLASYLLKPVQRMGKYALLLQQLMKVAKSDITDLQEAEAMVRFQLRHGNDLLAMDSLRECDVSPSIKRSSQIKKLISLQALLTRIIMHRSCYFIGV